ncbi:MAG TPA: hypothetical protein VEX39_00150, partial [Thermoleophilaceae bacterium]|nr:hypothetical protein [Thermoleophilaceae bacterium]
MGRSAEIVERRSSIRPPGLEVTMFNTSRFPWKRTAGLIAVGAAVGFLADGTLVGAQSGGGTIYACVFDNATGPNTRIVPEADLPCPERS